MKKRSQNRIRSVLNWAATAALCAAGSHASALGLGRLSVQSALGESLRAEIDITSLSPEEADNLRIRIAPPDAYRASGVDYNAVLSATQVQMAKRGDGRPYLVLSSERAVQEPFIDVILELSWATGRLVREYTLLFDPPSLRPAAAAPPLTSPVIIGTQTPQPGAASTAVRVPPALPAQSIAPPRAAKPGPGNGREAALPPAQSASAAVRPAAHGASAAPVDGYRVHAGETLSRIASRTQPAGVSLDQMLVALYRSNPQAFIGNNMNRLRSGTVLVVPNAAAAQAVAPAEAREVIQAQSADFGSYRQRLAGAVPTARLAGRARQDSGQVQAHVEDARADTGAVPDKLTLSKSTAAQGGKAVVEEKLSREREQRDAVARVAELSKNVSDLNRLSAAQGSVASAHTAVSPPPAASATSVLPRLPVAAANLPASAPASVPASAAHIVLPAVAASATASSVLTPAVPRASAVAAASAASPPPAVLVADTRQGALASVFEAHRLAFGLAGGVLAALAALGLYHFTRRPRKDSGETSFLESRLQPDSFFGASGGQRIDTRENGGPSSSMSYSLSQLDAIGDVDPVAEADVYLAYGRDLQAEEILKEAMRSTPERMAIRTKLLEVYAKRRDTKGFELLATQLYAMSQGQGDDWAHAQEMGLEIDPDNPLYQPGGGPASGGGNHPSQAMEPLGASTLPQTALPSPSEFGDAHHEPSVSAPAPDMGLDLDLDLGNEPAVTAGDAPPATLDVDNAMAFEPLAPADADEVSTVDPAATAAPDNLPDNPPVQFDLSSISLDLDDDPPVSEPTNAVTTPGDPIDLVELDDDDNPLQRKLELAEEFRQIGDAEGARDLLQEVASKGSGALQAKAQSMLDALG